MRLRVMSRTAPFGAKQKSTLDFGRCAVVDPGFAGLSEFLIRGRVEEVLNRLEDLLRVVLGAGAPPRRQHGGHQH